MVRLMAGKKGSGKSKEIVKLANREIEHSKGTMIFIDDDNRAMYDLHHDLRFVNLKEFPVDDIVEFSGFLCGLISNNYDIEKIYIDGVLNCVETTVEQLPNWLKKIEDMSTAYDIDFVITLNHEDQLPEQLKRYTM